MSSTRVCLVHGAATTAAVWDQVTAALPAHYAVSTPQREYSGSLDIELAALEAECVGAVVVGVSGGATLALALAMRGLPMRAVMIHEPAVGSLVPGLLSPMVAAYARDGVPGFGATLYGPLWTPSMAPADPEAVARDLSMFRGFEPGPATGQVVLTVGEYSPPVRYEAARALGALLDVPVRVLPGVGHAAQLEAPAMFAEVIVELAG